MGEGLIISLLIFRKIQNGTNEIQFLGGRERPLVEKNEVKIKRLSL
jgi:hypothetical protein